MTTDIISTGRIVGLELYIAGDKENEIDSYVDVTDKNAISSNGLPSTGGVCDSRMGTTSNKYRCGSCYNTKETCPGHNGIIRLRYPIQNALFKDEILKILQIVCHNCGEILISVKQSSTHSAKESIREHLKARRAVSTKDKPLICPKCDYEQPIVTKNPFEQMQIYIDRIDPATGKKITERLHNRRIAEIFGMISNEDLYKLGRNEKTHPSKLLLNTFIVPCNTIRPNVERGSTRTTSVNDITAILRNIVDINSKVPENINLFNKSDNDAIDLIDLLSNELVKGTPITSKKTKPVHVTGQSPVSLAESLPKKTGLLRKHCTGKRVRWSSRSVISCDPTIPINELGVPLKIAKIILIPVVVNKWNIEELNRYFANKNKQYPGCAKLWKKSSRRNYDVSTIGPDVILEIGDVLHRHLIDGDVVAFNRAPSLSPSHISTHRIRIRSDNSNTFQMNISACVLYSADFDGDEMSGHFPLSKQAQIEIDTLMSISERSTDYQYSRQTIGLLQDGNVGCALFTFNGQDFDKFDSMRLLSGTIRDYATNENAPDVKNPFSFNKANYSNYELVTKLLPNINFNAEPMLYKESLSHVIKYNPKDIRTIIENGIYKQGILDKKAIGQNSNASIIHSIKNKYGGDQALSFVFNMQQLVANYLLSYGLSLGIKDMMVSKSINEKVAELTSSIIGVANNITDTLNKNHIVPPIGVTVEEFYEQKQLAALGIADEFYQAVFSENINIKSALNILVTSGSKGNIKNMVSINSTIGQQTQNGERMDARVGLSRTLPYFTSWDTDPVSRGFIRNSYLGGMTSSETIFSAMDARFALIAQALTTATTGAQSRTSVKNLESILLDNSRMCAKGKNKIVELIYGDTGADPRALEISTVLTANLSNADFDTFHYKIKQVEKKYQNKELQDLFDAEFSQLKADREEYRRIMLQIEDHSGTHNRIYGNQFKTPINMVKIIKDILAEYKPTDFSLNYGDAIKQVRELCERLPYTAFNDIMWDTKKKVPDYWQKAVTLNRILIRSYLNSKYMTDNGFSNATLNVICDTIYNIMCNSYMPYGAAVGIIAAQSMSEPLTQFVLDSKHRSGGSGTKTDKVVRVAEIFGARPTDKMKNTTMVIQVLPEIAEDESKVQDIANHIEMMNVERFLLSGIELFYEKYGAPTYPKYTHESEMIKEFNKKNPLIKIPGDLLPWCIRFELNRREMILKNMSLDTIIRALQSMKDLFVVYTSETSRDLIVRIYVRATAVKKDDVISKMKQIIDEIREFVIRGVSGIYRAEVSKTQLLRSYIAEDGTIKTKKIYYITTDGTNLREVLGIPNVDPYHVQTDSILEIAEVYGIEAAREKICNELQTINGATITSGICSQHYRIYASEMTSTGDVTSIERTGISKRDGSIMLRISTSSPVQAFEEGAKNNMYDDLESPSAQLLVGATPRIGSTYNNILMNMNFVQGNTINTAQLLNDL